MSLSFWDASEERTRFEASLKERNEQFANAARELRSAAEARERQVQVGHVIAEGFAAHRSGTAVLNAIRTAAKRRGVLAELEHFVSMPMSGK